MCRSQSALHEAKKSSESIYVANAAEIPVAAVGSVKLTASVEGTYTDLDIANVLCVPDLALNLLSVSEICKKGYRVTFTSKACEVEHESTGDVIATAKQMDGLYKLDLVERNESFVAQPCGNLELWHRRLAHLNIDSVKRLTTMASGIEVHGSTMPSCVPCAEGKHRKQPFKSSGARAKDVLELIHSDLCGPMEKSSHGGSKYWITFIDDATKMTFAYFLKSKADAFSAFQEFMAHVENQSGKKIKCLRTDNGLEYLGQQFQDFLKKSGIRHERTVPYNPRELIMDWSI
ncbi:hypothetical protein RP20_CCG016888 [Aedes albopictus]|nr:hypothetical protein RP20_CCG016888 [Aedes albopictus]